MVKLTALPHCILKGGVIMSISEILIRILFAVIASGLIGYEREMRDRPAGFRTHILVCVGATIVSMMQIQMVENVKEMILQNPQLASSLKADIGRVIAQVVTGVGFLGAGTIIFHKGSVKGLTTATTLWVVACLGLAIGLGYYEISLIGTFVILFVIIGLKRIEDVARRRKYYLALEITYKDGEEDFLPKMLHKVRKYGTRVVDIKLSRESEKVMVCKLELNLTGITKSDTLISMIASSDNILSVSKV